MIDVLARLKGKNNLETYFLAIIYPRERNKDLKS